MSKRMLLGGVAAALGVLAVAIVLTAEGPSEPVVAAWPVTQVALATVTQLEAPRQVFAAGELEASRQVQVAAETSGRIQTIAFDSGQSIKPGQLLVQLNDAPERAERVRLRAQLHNARTLHQRTATLRTANVATQQQLDNATAALQMAQGELQQVEALIAQKAIRAPFGGTLGIRRVHQGHYLSAGEAVASLVDASTLRVNFSLNEQTAAHLQAGQALDLTVDALPLRTFQARVNAIDPLIGKSRQLQVQAVLDNPHGQLQAGMYASVRLRAGQPTAVRVVPETAITYTAYGQTVFIARRDGDQRLSVHRVRVNTGERWEGRVEVTSGLEVGDQVVVSGQLKLSDGMQVEPVATDTLADSVEGQAS
ncbi:efflux RND transporter periplasmic adaptor subunit [Pseudomonas aegrilactucae]|uniref:Efflux RND transporter periplasmic adaptor subunit n=1 Tax=Pseudomonas aegrilactucae TaxID=2854028 RepID=A0A9Q2XLB8_9PSED|nr:efflux RND transporter periplasmic adaptor subunit [Pseudomonas aegrilactucae]MBV6288793.1 efflux RND transporter periplasmic adaptor subunit [Pseudomonas aegrilactucae]